jgi:guanylate kinase
MDHRYKACGFCYLETNEVIHMKDYSPLVLLVGRSGTGKNYLCTSFGLSTVASCTTRPMRPGETDGIEHTFLTDYDFENLNVRRDMLAYSKRGDYHYWVTEDQLKGKHVYIIDPPGVEYFNMIYSGSRSVTVVLITSSLFSRIRNMRKRGDSWKGIIERLRIDRVSFKPFEESGNYDYKIVM